jgi:hypothetical protein
MNFTYAINPCQANVPVAVVMRSGQFTYYDKKMVVDFNLYVDSVERGSLQPGTRQAVVVIECDFPVGGVAAAYLFDERGRSAVRLGSIGSARWGGDWGAGPESIHVHFRRRLLYVSECGDDDCTTNTDTTYALREARLIKISTRTRNASP